MHVVRIRAEAIEAERLYHDFAALYRCKYMIIREYQRFIFRDDEVRKRLRNVKSSTIGVKSSTIDVESSTFDVKSRLNNDNS